MLFMIYSGFYSYHLVYGDLKTAVFLGGGAKHNEIAQSACNALKDTVQNN